MVHLATKRAEKSDSFVEVKELKKSFSLKHGKNLSVINVPSFCLGAGDQLAIFGGSGSGKSTFLNLLAGILTADFGSIRIGNIDISTLSEAERDVVRSKFMGYVFQSFHLLQGCTALENILVTMSVGGSPNKEKARDLLSRVGMSEKENFLPAQLSMGQQQRVGIARALANEPKLILADEPTGSLDPENSKQSIELLKSLSNERECSLIVVSHDRSVVDRFDSSMKWEEINQADMANNES